MRSRSLSGPFTLFCLSAALLTGLGRAERLSVSSVSQLHAALLNKAVSDVDLLPGTTHAAWNFSREAWPSQVVLEREVALVGVDGVDGQPPYIDFNRLTELVVVRAPGRLTQRNLHADDCLVPVMPLLCFVVGADNGSLLVQDTLLGDASCTHIDQSAAADWLLKSAYWATWRTSWQKVDERSVLIADTGEISGLPHGVRWRVANTTLRCTANETHPLPPGAAAPPAGAATHPSDMQLAAATSATLLATLALLYYALNRNVVYVHRDDSPEVAAARSRGIVLQTLIGQGTFGRVYRGLYRGETVAVKFIEFPQYERRAAVEVARECAHVLACRHASVARCITHFTVTVRTQLRREGTMHQLRASGQAYAHEQHLQRPLAERNAGAAASNDRPSTSAAPARAAPPPSASPPMSASSCGPGSLSCGEGLVAVLVLEYCPLGSLHRALAEGRFLLDRRARRPNLDWVCRTGRDVAEALAHLHEERGWVHRDVSTSNVLLTPDAADPRRFRAKLSDFGLSTALAGGATHRTSQLRGTLDFMPPEIFTCGEVRYAVDVYALGILICWMWAGESPYSGAPFQVVGRKLEEVHRQQRLLLPPDMPPALRRLVWDCCHWDPKQRPTAFKAAAKLTDIILTHTEARAHRRMQGLS